MLLYCGQTPPIDSSTTRMENNPSTIISAEDTMRETAGRVVEEARSKLTDTETLSAVPIVNGDEGALADNSLAAIRARIEAYAKSKHDIEQQIEEQHRATHGVHQQYAQEKHELAQAQAGVRQVCAQYGVLLKELEGQAEQYKHQRSEAERVLRECSFSLEMAVDTMTQKVKLQCAY